MGYFAVRMILVRHRVHLIYVLNEANASFTEYIASVVLIQSINFLIEQTYVSYDTEESQLTHVSKMP
jgi:hypothetical protein